MAEELSLETILPKDASTLTEEEKQHLNDHKSQLNPEQLEKFASVLTGADNPSNGTGEENKESGENTNQ